MDEYNWNDRFARVHHATKSVERQGLGTRNQGNQGKSRGKGRIYELFKKKTHVDETLHG